MARTQAVEQPQPAQATGAIPPPHVIPGSTAGLGPACENYLQAGIWIWMGLPVRAKDMPEMHHVTSNNEAVEVYFYVCLLERSGCEKEQAVNSACGSPFDVWKIQQYI